MKEEYEELIAVARAAIQKGFYTDTKPQKRYGAAVLTASGRIYSAGQYSSFNHITSIHAEMGAILLATMSGDEKIEALALACTEKKECRSCGVCLQFIKEHALRTGIDIKLIYENELGTIVMNQSELTINMW